jgi:hypothetical protein
MNILPSARALRCGLAGAAACLTLGAAHAGEVRLQAASPVTAGDLFVVTMTGSGFEPIVGGGADLSFSADLLELVSVEFAPMWSFITSPGVIDNTAGTVTGLYFNLFGQAEGDFGRGHGNDEKNEEVAVHRPVIAGESDQREIHRVEHELQRHVDDQSVLPENHPKQADREEQSGEENKGVESDGHIRSSFLNPNSRGVASTPR